LDVPSLDNKPRYGTLEVYQLPPPEPTPVAKARNRRVTDDVLFVTEPLVRANLKLDNPIVLKLVKKTLDHHDRREEWLAKSKGRTEQQDEQRARGEGDKEGCFVSGPLGSKRNPLGVFDSEDEQVVDKRGRKWRERRMDELIGFEWEGGGKFSPGKRGQSRGLSAGGNRRGHEDIRLDYQTLSKMEGWREKVNK